MNDKPVVPVNEHGQPDLQRLLAESGGYHKITPQQWQAWDNAVAAYQQRRRHILAWVDELLAQPPKLDPSPFEACASCGQEGRFGYRDKESGELVWFCKQHRLAVWWADARR